MSNMKSTRAGKNVAAPALVEDVAGNGRGLAGGAGRELTALQKGFVSCFTSMPDAAGDPGKAAIAAGYAKKNAGEIARQLLKLPHIVDAIDISLRAAIGTRLTVKAIGVIETILDSKEATLKLKGDMAAKVIEFSGLVERTKADKAGAAGMGGKKLAEMSRAELEAVVAQGAAVLHAAANLPPAGAVIEGQVLGDSAQDNAQDDSEADE